jgi:hypothetical protein
MISELKNIFMTFLLLHSAIQLAVLNATIFEEEAQQSQQLRELRKD